MIHLVRRALRAEVRVVWRVLRLAWGERRTAALVTSLGLVSALFEGMGLSFLIPLARVAMGESIDFSIPVIGPVLAWLDARTSISSLQIVMFVVGFFFLGIIVGYINLVISSALAMRFAHRLRMQVFETALSRPLSAIESLPSGKFVNSLVSETWKVCDALFVVIGASVQVVTIGVFLGFLFLLSPFYTLVLIAMTAVMVVVVHLATRAVRGLGMAAVAANERFMAFVWDTLGGLRVIRGFGREAHERARFRASSDQVRHVFVRMRTLSGAVQPLTQMMTVAIVATLLGLALFRENSLGTLVGFLAIAYRMQPRITSILIARTHLRGLEASVDAIEEALVVRRIKEPPKWRHFRRLRCGIRLDGISARYPNAEHPALHNISCTFAYGQMTAVAGYSGAGKSTLVALLLRFIEPEKGRVLVDDVPLSDIEPESWHRRIAFVEQNTFLFNASVRDNIGYGDLDADFLAIEEVARAAQADEFVRALPMGYDTVIGESGVRLSQGQRQRIALARSLLRKPDVLILDEATNALDRPTERALRNALEDARERRAIIVIAHRRETIEAADQVVVLDHGHLVEAGTPEKLGSLGGVYSRLYLDESSSAG